MRCTATSLAIVLALPASAETIAFTHAGVGMGTLNGVAFARTPFVIHATADTAAREEFDNGFRINHQFASIDILGLGSFQFLIGTSSFVNRVTEVVGIGRTGPIGTARSLVVGPYNSVWANWDMTTSIGPVHGVGSVGDWSSQFGAVHTTGGVLFFESEAPVDLSFTAVVPAPSAAATLGLAALAGARRRRRS